MNVILKDHLYLTELDSFNTSTIRLKNIPEGNTSNLMLALKLKDVHQPHVCVERLDKKDLMLTRKDCEGIDLMQSNPCFLNFSLSSFRGC